VRRIAEPRNCLQRGFLHLPVHGADDIPSV
jgi:hypothetical protein